MEIALLVVGAVVLVAYCFEVLARLKHLRANMDAISVNFQRLTDDVETLKHHLASVEWSLLPEDEKQKKRFEQLPDFFLADVRALKEESVVHLVSKSYYSPLEFPVFNQFEYKHARLDESASPEFGVEVHGFSRSDPTSKWSPFVFLAKPDGCTTSSCSGTIKRGHVEW